MKTSENLNMPTQPIFNSSGIASNKAVLDSGSATGLTKREHVSLEFAKAYLTGMLSNGNSFKPTPQDVAKVALEYTNALFNELDWTHKD